MRQQDHSLRLPVQVASVTVTLDCLHRRPFPLALAAYKHAVANWLFAVSISEFEILSSAIEHNSANTNLLLLQLCCFFVQQNYVYPNYSCMFFFDICLPHLVWDSIVISRLTTEIRSEKCVVRRFRRCANVIECAYTNLESIAYYTSCLRIWYSLLLLGCKPVQHNHSN